MTRQLPWKRKSELQTPVARRSSTKRTSSTPENRALIIGLPDSRKSVTPGSSAAAREPREGRSRLLSRKVRTPSTSPPPAPPVESLMIEGIENDDQYRMVEDEFLSVARTFTAHLHAAEYQRLKALAKVQNADAINSISRPVTGEMSYFVRHKQEARSCIVKQHRGLKRALANANGDTGCEGAPPWVGTSLQGLMESPRAVKAIPLAAVASTSAASATRAAAGYQEGSPAKPSRFLEDHGASISTSTRRSSSPTRNSALRNKAATSTSDTSDESDDDDLDGPAAAVATLPRSLAFPIQPSHRTPVSSDHSRPARRAVSFVPEAMSKKTGGTSTDDAELSDSLDASNLLRRSRERRAREISLRQGRREAERAAKPEDQDVNMDVIPSFL